METVNSYQIPLLWIVIVIFLLVFESAGIGILAFIVVKNLKKIKENSVFIIKNRKKILKNKSKITELKA